MIDGNLKTEVPLWRLNNRVDMLTCAIEVGRQG